MNILQRLVHRVARQLATVGAPADTHSTVLAEFCSRCEAMDGPRVLELGTRGAGAARAIRHEEWVPRASEYLGTDIEQGDAVDIVADVHRLSDVTGEEQFDVIIACSTFEHFKYPHLAAHQVMKVLRPGGLVFIQTHLSFPLKESGDYFRFTADGLAGLFGARIGAHVVATAYEFPARIYSRRLPDTAGGASFLNVILLAEKVAATPSNYVYEFDRA